MIEAHRAELEAFGELRALSERNQGPRGRRPTRSFWLNRQQAILLTILSRTPTAVAVRAEVVRVFDAYMAGRTLPPRPLAGEDLSHVLRAAPAGDTAAVLAGLNALVPEIGAVWSGTPARLLEALTAALPNDPHKTPSWPRVPQTLTTRLEKLAPMLPGQGLVLRRSRGEQRNIYLKRTAAAPPGAAPAALPGPNPLGVLHGWDAIGAELGLTRDAAEALHLPVFTIDGHACAHREDLRAWINRERAAARSAAGL